MSKYAKTTGNAFQLSWLDFSKFLFFVLFLYLNWYKEIWGDVPIVLYGSVVALTLSLILPFGNSLLRFLNLRNLTGFYKVLLAFGVYSFISGIIVCSDRTLLISSIITYFSYMVVLFDCCLISQRDGGWSWLLNTMVLVALTCCIQVIFWGKPMLNGGATAITMSALNNPNTVSVVLMYGIFGMVADSKHRMERLWIRVPLILMFLYAIILTGSRKAIIATLFLLMLWMYSILRTQRTENNKSRNAGTVFLVFCTSALILVLLRRKYLNSEQYERLMQLFEEVENPGDSKRVELYYTAFDIWKQHPIFGVGFDQYQLYTRYGHYSHSTYAEVLSCTGILGSLLLFVPFLKYTFNVISCVLRSEGEYQYRFLMCLAGLMIELFLGIGQIWVYGLNHALFIVCVLSMFEYSYQLFKVNLIQFEVDKRCQYIK